LVQLADLHQRGVLARFGARGERRAGRQPRERHFTTNKRKTGRGLWLGHGNLSYVVQAGSSNKVVTLRRRKVKVLMLVM